MMSQENRNKKEPIFTKRFLLVTLSMFFTGSVMYGLNSTTAEVASSFGATATLAGIATGIYSISSLMSRLSAARLMEHFGWKKMTLAVFFLHILTCLLYFAAVNLPLLILVRFLHGLAYGASASAVATIGMSLIPRSRYGEGAGYFMTAPALATAFGPALGGAIMDRFGNGGGFLFSTLCAVMMFLGIVLSDLSDIDPGPSGNRAKTTDAPKGLDRWIETSVLPVCLCMLLLSISYAGILSFLRPFGQEQQLSTAAFFLIYSLILIISRPVSGRIQDRFGDNAVVIPGILLQAASLAALAIWPGMVSMMFAALGCALGYGTLKSCIQSIAARLGPGERRAYSVTTFWICSDGGMGIGPMLLGTFISLWGYRGMFLGTALIALAVLPLYLISRRNAR